MPYMCRYSMAVILYLEYMTFMRYSYVWFINIMLHIGEWTSFTLICVRTGISYLQMLLGDIICCILIRFSIKCFLLVGQQTNIRIETPPLFSNS
jgi:hypothetical protein